MPKKNMTPEERKAWGQKMKEAREKKKNEKANTESSPADIPAPNEPMVEEPTANPDGTPATTVQNDHNASDFEELLARVLRLAESGSWQGAGVNPQGKLIGTVEKYTTNRAVYENPVPSLMEEEKLQRFAFKENYELAWNIEDVSYTNIDGVRTKEPKFILDLIRVIYDEATGEKTNGRYTVCRLVMHEDPDAAIQIANDNNILIEEDDEERFLNAMRYLRAKDWLLECFYPKPSTDTRNKKEVVIGGQIVEYWEVNSESTAPIPFNQLDQKKKLRT